MWCVRTLHWKGTELIGKKIKFEIKNFDLKFWIYFNIIITVYLRKVIKESGIYLK